MIKQLIKKKKRRRKGKSIKKPSQVWIKHQKLVKENNF